MFGFLTFGNELVSGNQGKQSLSYSPFHKTSPKSSLKMHWISARFYEMGDISTIKTKKLLIDDIRRLLGKSTKAFDLSAASASSAENSVSPSSGRLS